MDAARSFWLLKCAATVVPLTAIFHHAVFYRPRCMLKGFGSDYDLVTLLKWLTRDPSLPWAIVVVSAIHAIGIKTGRYARVVRESAVPFVVAFAPLAVWIWDLPFSGRWVCRTFHDERLTVAFIGVVHSRHFYILGLLVCALVVVRNLVERRHKRIAVPGS